MRNCALFGRSNTSWLETDRAMCFLLVTAASVLSCIVTIPGLRLTEPMTSQPAAVTFSRSPGTAVVSSIHGVASKTYDCVEWNRALEAPARRVWHLHVDAASFQFVEHLRNALCPGRCGTRPIDPANVVVALVVWTGVVLRAHPGRHQRLGDVVGHRMTVSDHVRGSPEAPLKP